MKVLSIRQPWAWLIVNGYKDVENRTWAAHRSMIGQRFLVHAGKSFDPREVASAVHAAKTIVPKLDVYKMVREAQSTLGGIVGDVLMTE